VFDRNKLKIKPLSERVHDEKIKTLDEWKKSDINFQHPHLPTIAQKIKQAKDNGRPIVLMMGAHVIRKGLSPLIIDLMEKGYITHVATNGASAIHDYEFSLIGATAESVPRYIKEGQFGLWEETGQINDIINLSYVQNTANGFGTAVGRAIMLGDFPNQEISLFAAAYNLGKPVTVHVGIGYDIIHQHPNCDGAAIGDASYSDFLTFAGVIQNLEGGVLLNFGSAVMGPEVYLKALAMARNLAHQQGKEIRHFTTAVFDLADIGDDTSTEQPKDTPTYYFRPYKTMLVRTVADGGQSFYVRGNHAETLPGLYNQIIEIDN